MERSKKSAQTPNHCFFKQTAGGGWCTWLLLFHFLFQHGRELLCLFREPIKCCNWPPTTVTGPEWKTLKSMTHRGAATRQKVVLSVRRGLWALEWNHSRDALIRMEEKVLLWLCFFGIIVSNGDQKGSMWVNMPAEFYSWSAFATMDDGACRLAPNIFKLYLKPMNVTEYGLWFEPFFFNPFSPFVATAATFVRASRQHNFASKLYCMVDCDSFVGRTEIVQSQ